MKRQPVHRGFAAPGPRNRPRELGRAVGLELLDKGAAEIIERSRPG